MYSTLKIKTKINKRRLERKIEKKKHNLIRCKCRSCGKKKWTQYNKKSNKVLSLIIINTLVWLFAYNSFEAIRVKTLVLVNPSLAAVRETEQADSLKKDLVQTSSKVGIDPMVVRLEEEEKASSPLAKAGIEDKIKAAFPHSPEVALAIAKAESGLDVNKPSSVDITKDGHVFSWGLFQLNLTVTNINGVACNEAFEGRNSKAVVKDKKLFEKCVKLATDPELNIKVAVQKYERRGNYTAWGSFTNKSYLRFL